MYKEKQHSHCVNCISRRCMTRPEIGVSCNLIWCPLVCGAVFHLCKADEHRMLCPLERVPCLNSGFGCPSTVTRNKIAEHLNVCPASVVCCTMEWNRWPLSFADRKSYESLSKDVDEVEQLDMALALQDQRMLLESLKVATNMSKRTAKRMETNQQISVNTCASDAPLGNCLLPGDEGSYNALYQATVETTKSLTAALDILNTASRDIDMLNGKLNEADGDVNNIVKSKSVSMESLERRTMMDQEGSEDDCTGAVGGIDFPGQNCHVQQNGSSDVFCNINHSDLNKNILKCSKAAGLCNGFHLETVYTDRLEKHEVDLSLRHSKQAHLTNGDCLYLEESEVNALKPYLLPISTHLPEEMPYSSLPNGAHTLLLPQGMGREQVLEQKLEERVLRNVAVFGREPFLVESCWFKTKKEDKSVDTSDLEVVEDPMGLQGIDLITAALLFCLGDSPSGRGISDSRCVDGYRIDFGTQTFSFPSAILANNTMVGEIASASACDHANPQLSNPSPFQTLGLDLVLECVARYQTKQRSMFTFVCGQLFRRDEFSSHFKNVHGDIHAGLNGWMEQRCPLAYYGCTYSQRRFCPSTQGSKIIHDRHLKSFGVQPCFSVPLEYCVSLFSSYSDHLSGLPFEILQHIAGFLDGFSLCQLSRVSRLMRDVCASLLQGRGMVVLLWEKRHYANGRSSWQIKEKVWRFSTAFCSISEWKFANIISMSDHLKQCSFNTIEKKEEAFPLPCMCVSRELTKEGRSLRSVLKPVL
ncbi:F-box only protein 30 isoform X2 [Ambystoma mexicanum]